MSCNDIENINNNIIISSYIHHNNNNINKNNNDNNNKTNTHLLSGLFKKYKFMHENYFPKFLSVILSVQWANEASVTFRKESKE